MTSPRDDLVEQLRDYGVTAEPDVIICDRRAVEAAATRIEQQAARIAELEGTLITFGRLRAARAALNAKPVEK
jgi:hypothetical protein